MYGGGGERERELVCTSNGGGVIMVIGREKATVRSTNLRTKDSEKERGRGRAKRAWQGGNCRRKGMREKGEFREGYFLSFREKMRLFWE